MSSSKESIKKMTSLIEDQYLEYKVGDLVWHRASPDSGQGVIINWRLHGDDGSVEYLVSFAPGFSIEVTPIEITLDKPIT